MAGQVAGAYWNLKKLYAKKKEYLTSKFFNFCPQPKVLTLKTSKGGDEKLEINLMWTLSQLKYCKTYKKVIALKFDSLTNYIRIKAKCGPDKLKSIQCNQQDQKLGLETSDKRRACIH